jgi:hypothetical protein
MISYQCTPFVCNMHTQNTPHTLFFLKLGFSHSYHIWFFFNLLIVLFGALRSCSEVGSWAKAGAQTQKPMHGVLQGPFPPWHSLLWFSSPSWPSTDMLYLTSFHVPALSWLALTVLSVHLTMQSTWSPWLLVWLGGTSHKYLGFNRTFCRLHLKRKEQLALGIFVTQAEWCLRPMRPVGFVSSHFNTMLYFKTFKIPIPMNLDGVLVSQGCCDKVPHTDYLKWQKTTLSPFWRPEVQDQDYHQTWFLLGLLSLACR